MSKKTAEKMSQKNKGIKKIILLTIASKKKKTTKIFRNKFKRSSSLYTENHKTMLKEIKEDLHKWKDICIHGREGLDIVKRQYSQN